MRPATFISLWPSGGLRVKEATSQPSLSDRSRWQGPLKIAETRHGPESLTYFRPIFHLHVLVENIWNFWEIWKKNTSLLMRWIFLYVYLFFLLNEFGAKINTVGLVQTRWHRLRWKRLVIGERGQFLILELIVKTYKKGNQNERYFCLFFTINWMRLSQTPLSKLKRHEEQRMNRIKSGSKNWNVKIKKNQKNQYERFSK